jgi:Na+/glutamate symporter
MTNVVTPRERYYVTVGGIVLATIGIVFSIVVGTNYCSVGRQKINEEKSILSVPKSKIQTEETTIDNNGCGLPYFTLGVICTVAIVVCVASIESKHYK